MLTQTMLGLECDRANKIATSYKKSDFYFLFSSRMFFLLFENAQKTKNTRKIKLECKFLHEQVDVLIHLESLQVVGISLQSHQQPSERHVRRSATKMRKINQKFILQKIQHFIGAHEEGKEAQKRRRRHCGATSAR
jgi:hypothetical protein